MLSPDTTKLLLTIDRRAEQLEAELADVYAIIGGYHLLVMAALDRLKSEEIRSARLQHRLRELFKGTSGGNDAER